ncbi:MAG TPA: hypothetical protein VIV59_00060 [Anaeromyxobacteraceae bacterium]
MRLVDQIAALLRRLASPVPPPPDVAWLPVPVTPPPRRAPAARKTGRAR